MNTLAVRSRAQSKDYEWKSSDPLSDKWYVEIASLCDESPSYVALATAEDQINLFIGGLGAGVTDFRQRNIRVDVAVKGLSNIEARAVLRNVLCDREGFQKHLGATISRPDGENWEVDFDKLRSDLRAEEEGTSDETVSPSFQSAWERILDKETLSLLADELTKYSFSDGPGLKLLVCDAPQEKGYHRARREADRFLWQTESECNLSAWRAEEWRKEEQKKKYGPRKASQLATGDGSGSNNSQSRCLKKYFDGCFKDYLKNGFIASVKRGFLAIIAILTIGVIGLAIVMILIVQTCTKKAEQKLSPPEDTASPVVSEVVEPAEAVNEKMEEEALDLEQEQPKSSSSRE